MSFALVVGTRPNFVKAAAVLAGMASRKLECKLIHTGQHFDAALSDSFFARLGLPAPDVHLGVAAGSRAAQLGSIVSALAETLPRLGTRELVVVGDVTSTVAGALAADALDLRVSHVEAGLRSFDDAMPEERNRKLTDAIAHRLFVSEPAGVANLAREGVAPSRVHLVGNVMIDTLLRFKQGALDAAPWSRLGVERGHYAVATLHRPSNVDHPLALAECVTVLSAVGQRMPVLFAVHPRTTQRLAASGMTLPPSVRALPPQDYFDFLGLMAGAKVVLTDSGGAQEETTALGTPCLTMRDNTERPITCEKGTSRLVGRRLPEVVRALDELDAGTYPLGEGVPLWDGQAGRRIADLLAAT